jgi:hypothetical protein
MAYQNQPKIDFSNCSILKTKSAIKNIQRNMEHFPPTARFEMLRANDDNLALICL